MRSQKKHEVRQERNFRCVDVDHELNLSDGGLKSASLTVFLLGGVGYKLRKK